MSPCQVGLLKLMKIQAICHLLTLTILEIEAFTRVSMRILKSKAWVWEDS